MVDFWLITYKNIKNVPKLLQAFRECGLPYQVTILDNSEDPEIITELTHTLRPPERIIAADSNLCCGGGSRYLLTQTEQTYIVYCCASHTVINDPSWVRDAVQVMENDPEIGLVGDLVPYAGLWYYAAHWSEVVDPLKRFPSRLPLLQDTFSRQEIYEKANTQAHIQGGVWAGRRKAIVDIGGWEPALPHMFIDIEISTRMQCYGWKLGHLPCVRSEYASNQITEHPEQFKVLHTYGKTNV